MQLYCLLCGSYLESVGVYQCCCSLASDNLSGKDKLLHSFCLFLKLRTDIFKVIVCQVADKYLDFRCICTWKSTNVIYQLFQIFEMNLERMVLI